MANLLPRIGFVDETSLKTNMAKTTGWSVKGARLIDHAPFGHWNTQTFIAALRHDRLDAPWVIEGAMNRDLFELYVETQLVPTLLPGDVIILDNLSSHKSPKAADAMRAIGAWFLFRCSGKTVHWTLFLSLQPLQPRSQSHRNGLRKAQGSYPKGGRPELRRSLARRRTRL